VFDTGARLGTRVQCPVCRQQIGLNRLGQIVQHMWNRRVPRKRPGSQDPISKELRRRCPGSGLSQ
jgi:hypothetical protein